MKVPSKKIGEIAGKAIKSTKSLPSKTAKTGRNLKEEFIAGYRSTAV